MFFNELSEFGRNQSTPPTSLQTVSGKKTYGFGTAILFLYNNLYNSNQSYHESVQLKSQWLSIIKEIIHTSNYSWGRISSKPSIHTYRNIWNIKLKYEKLSPSCMCSCIEKLPPSSQSGLVRSAWLGNTTRPLTTKGSDHFSKMFHNVAPDLMGTIETLHCMRLNTPRIEQS